MKYIILVFGLVFSINAYGFTNTDCTSDLMGGMNCTTTGYGSGRSLMPTITNTDCTSDLMGGMNCTTTGYGSGRSLMPTITNTDCTSDLMGGMNCTTY